MRMKNKNEVLRPTEQHLSRKMNAGKLGNSSSRFLHSELKANWCGD
jgi:hypothetical protein